MLWEGVDRVIFAAQLFVALSVIMAMRILYLYLTLTLKGLLIFFFLLRVPNGDIWRNTKLK